MLLEVIEEMLTLIGGLIVAYIVYVFFTKQNDKPSTDPPTMAHTALRDIVERAVEEARKLPGLGSGSGGQEGRNITEHSYEDLLATAILNKVIEKFQREQVDGNSNVLHEKSASRTKCTLSESELGLDEGVEEGCSSLEPLSQDDCSSDCGASFSRHVRNQLEPLSLTIEERIEEVTTTYSSDDDPRDNDVLVIRNTHRVPFPELGMDIIDPSQESEDSQDEPDTPKAHMDMISPIESWEENWLFQKKRVQKQADPVSMLVPNSSTDFKALIGDKDAEDTSDLSECSSAQSDEEIEKELMEAINNVVPRSPKEKDFEETSDNHRETLNNGTLPNGVCEKQNDEKIEILKKTDSRNPKESNIKTDTRQVKTECNNREKNTESLKSVEYSIDRDGENETKEINPEPSDLEIKNPATDETDGNFILPQKLESDHKISELSVAEGSKNIEVFEKSNAESKEKILEVDDKYISQESKAEGCFETNRSHSDKLTETTSSVVLTEETVPKTPTCTPTRNSVTEDSTASPDDQETLNSNGENVLNSLECAKKILMVVDDDAAEIFEKPEDARHKADFQTEDVQQESEYTEHYDIAIQRHLDSLTKTDISGGESELNIDDSKCREAVAFAKAESASYSSLRNGNPEENVQLATPPRPGTIAEREHKKWENAPPIENNPYSEENIQKRLWERQYSRRSSDIPGIHAELPKSNGADLEVALTPPEPDIKRFGRDYYINESKTPSGEKIRRSTSTSSRPSSSLSHRSSSTGDQQEQQVSFELDKFEGASLRGNLSRRSYRDSPSSLHFAINPLLHLELDDKGTPNTHPEISDDNAESKLSNNMETSENNLIEYYHLDDNIPKITNDSTSGENIQLVRREDGNGVVFNPIYEIQQEYLSFPEKSNPDRDSGMYSIESNDLETTSRDKKQDDDSWRKLCWKNTDDNAKENQILSLNGKRYWNTGGHKYHTFGGIKSVDIKSDDQFEEDNYKTEIDETLSLDVPAFGEMKFQTFGGIKGNRKIDAKGIPTYRKIKLRPSLRYLKSPKGSKCSDESLVFREREDHKENVRINLNGRSIEEDDWRDENCEKNIAQFQDDLLPENTFEQDTCQRQTRRIFSSSRRSSTDDDWQDEHVQVSDKIIMSKFLKDATKRVKSRARSEDSNYSVNTSRRKIFAHGKVKPQKKHHRSMDGDENLKLEPPIVPEVVERTFETLKDLRNSRRKKIYKEPATCKKPGIRSLSDVTIW